MILSKLKMIYATAIFLLRNYSYSPCNNWGNPPPPEELHSYVILGDIPPPPKELQIPLIFSRGTTYSLL